MGLSFIELSNKLNEAGPAPPMPAPKPGGAPLAGPPQSPPGGIDPMAGGMGAPMPSPAPGGAPDPLGGPAPSGAAPTGKPKIIKITTVWDALENVLDGKTKKATTKETGVQKKKEDKKPKSIYT